MKLTFTSPYNKNVASVYAEVEQTDQDDFGNGEYIAPVPVLSWETMKLSICEKQGCRCWTDWKLELSEPESLISDYHWHKKFKLIGTDSNYPDCVILKIW